MTTEKKANITEKKKKIIVDIAKLFNESRSMLIVSIKNVPDNQLQVIKKKLKPAVIKVLKKSVSERVIDSIEKGTIKNLKKYIKEDIALVFSNNEPFELALILSRNKSKGRAKIGQIVESDIEIEPGPTELVPGPIISELTALGLKFSIEDGKINIREKKTILKAGEKVTEAAAGIMAKFDMKPMSIGLEPVVAYDSKEDKIFESIKIDEKKTLDELKDSKARALGLAVKIAYACKETIGFLLAKAKSHENALSKFIKSDNQINIQGGQ